MHRRVLILMVLAGTIFAASCKKKTESPPPREKTGAAAAARTTKDEAVRVAMIPKLLGIDYFNASEKGAKEAAQELGIELIYNGPVENQVERQIEMVDSFIAQGVDVIALAPNDPVAVGPVLKRAMDRGIHVITWDADAQKDSRTWFVNQAPYDLIGKALVDIMARLAGEDARTAIVTGSLTAENQNIWMEEMRKHMESAYPDMTVETVKPSEEDQQLAYKVTQDLLKAYSDLDGIFGITSVSLPGAGEAVRNAGMTGKIVVTGLSTPDSMRSLVKDDVVKSFVLWDPVDLGYLTIHVAHQTAKGTLKPGDASMRAGRLGEVEIRGQEIVLGEPLEFTKDNIDDYHF